MSRRFAKERSFHHGASSGRSCRFDQASDESGTSQKTSIDRVLRILLNYTVNSFDMVHIDARTGTVPEQSTTLLLDRMGTFRGNS